MKETKRKTFRQILDNETVSGYIFAAPFIIGLLAFTLIPVLVSFYYSFTDYNLIQKEALIGLNNYRKLFGDPRFLKSVKVTLVFVIVSVPLKLIFALLVAQALTRKSKAVTTYRSLYYVPSLIGGSIAVALAWKALFGRKGLINQILEMLGFGALSWFGNQKLAMVPLILMAAWQFGSSMIIFAAGLKEIPSTYYEAARIDGAGPIHIFRKITLPCLSPIILYNLVMQTIAGFMTFNSAFVITKGGPNDATNFYSLYVYTTAFKYYDMGYASAMSWVMLVLISIITFIIFKSSKMWVFSEAES